NLTAFNETKELFNLPIDDIKDIIAQKIACHSSVRGKQKLTDEELDKLLDDLALTKDPAHCPHGRPTKIRFTMNDFRKMFKRIG
ncbi:hypothetical protein MCHI_001583, partial [Candidatus Magnetoovum chiemensis]